jgi:23S rRNA (adenine-N6)-dimethyltransferase
VARGARTTAVEIDPILCARLREELGDSAEILHADFLAWRLPRGSYRVVGNVPYARTSAIVRRLVSAPRPPEDAWLVVQREAALRFAGSPWGRETRLSLLLAPWWHREVALSLRRTDFEPPPAVDSVLLWMARRARPLVAASEARLYRKLTDGLLASGPTWMRALRPWLTRAQLARLARDLRIDPAAPPSGLRFDQWLPLFRFAAREGRVRRAGRATQGAGGSSRG